MNLSQFYERVFLYDWNNFRYSSFTGCSNACFLGTNNSNPPGTHCPFTGGSSFNSDSATGECIAERVGGNEYGGGNPVAEFNPPGHLDQITSCDVNNSPIGSQSHNYMVLVNGVGGGQLLIGVGSISNNTDFQFQWHQSS